MPEKEGSDDEKKSTKSVVNKKEKQFMNQESLDLIKIAEAFGGYVVEANGKNGKKNGKKNNTIDDFIDAEDPFDPSYKSDARRAQQDAQRDIEQTGGTDTRPNFTRTDSFQQSGKFKQPEKNPVRKKGAKPKPGTQKLADTTIGGPVKIIQKATRKSTAAPREPDAAKFTNAASTRDFKKDLEATGEPIASAGMESDINTITKQGRKAEKVSGASGEKPTGSISKGTYKSSPAGQKAYDAEKKRQAGVEFTNRQSYADRIARAYDIGSGAPRVDSQPLPPAPKSSKKDLVRTPQKDRPVADSPASGTFSGKGVGRKDFVGNTNVKVTGGEYGKLRSGETADQDALNQALIGRDAQGNPLTSDQRKELMKKSRGSSSNAVNNVSKNLTKGEMPRVKKIDPPPSGFEQGKSGTFTRKPESTMDKLTKRVRDMTVKTQTAQQSVLGALGGFVTKGVMRSAAGAEAGMRFYQGDKTGATLSALQAMGGGLGFGAGVLNAIRSVRAAKGAKGSAIQKFTGDPEKAGMAAAAGGMILPKLGDALPKTGIPQVKGGKVGRRSAKQ